MEEIIFDEQIKGADEFINVITLMVQEAKNTQNLSTKMSAICHSQALNNVVKLKVIDVENPLIVEKFYYWKQTNLI